MTMTHFSIRAGSALVAFSASLLSLTASHAADLPPIYETPLFETAPELQPVEIGTGWYLRGDVGYAFKGENTVSINRRAPFSSGSEYGTFDENVEGKWSAGIGAGYRFNDWLRADATAEWLANADVGLNGRTPCTTYRSIDYGTYLVDRAEDDECDIAGSADLDVYNYMANAYVDLGTYVGFTPYVGAGLGVANFQTTAKANETCNETADPDVGCLASVANINYGSPTRETTVDFDDSTWQLSYSLMAGLGYNVSKNLTLDVGYRYLSVPEYKAFGIKNDDGFDIHQIRAGVRYSLW
ncbi:MAG: porin family protein [Fulvimarina manganoxydans]|uniref:outer membrane protein n=1 Tax=Fulvimarina manganoxydans TaxID=937218 RepID=UPI0023530ECF|nr:outer membrane protein [Fulvimarina manganoxydans]MCK5932587.1 porin family protein [Fulvimarina manganoxydans]